MVYELSTLPGGLKHGLCDTLFVHLFVLGCALSDPVAEKMISKKFSDYFL